MKPLFAQITFVLSLVLTSSLAIAQPAADFIDKLQADSRPAADKARDGTRRPIQAINLLGIDEGMAIVDVQAGGGWYTRVLSAAVGSSGRVISNVGPRALERENGQAARDMAAELGNVDISFDALDEIDASNADVAIAALEIHHANMESGVVYLQSMARVVKPGGKIIIIDHEGNPGADNSSVHRIAKQDVLTMAQAAGLELEMESDLLHTNADDHSQMVFSPLLGRNTDRFILVFSK
ncbi:MAG: class I SAM-dependent methyltransferase [Gammaproteobacteria bacterium]|nr:class I SAM-dependent methyltransferase [Gammaproteobacteria bacterium]